jgi:hypothetical protein
MHMFIVQKRTTFIIAFSSVLFVQQQIYFQNEYYNNLSEFKKPNWLKVLLKKNELCWKLLVNITEDVV